MQLLSPQPPILDKQPLPLPQPLLQPQHENKSNKMIIHEQLFPNPLFLHPLLSLQPQPQFVADNSLIKASAIFLIFIVHNMSVWKKCYRK